jgi:hypothetical protein
MRTPRRLIGRRQLAAVGTAPAIKRSAHSPRRPRWAVRWLLKRVHPDRHALAAGRFQTASGTGSRRRVRSMHWRNSLTTGHGRANRRMLRLFGSILCYEDGDLNQVAVNAPVESDDVSSVGVLEFLHVPGHSIASNGMTLSGWVRISRQGKSHALDTSGRRTGRRGL